MATATVVCSDSKRASKVIDLCNHYSSSVIEQNLFLSEIGYKVPFKIRVFNITVPGYSPTNPAPIGIAIIGFNNYIL
jgi:hypothetical protein